MKILVSNIENRKSFDIYNIVRRYFHKKDIILSTSTRSLVYSYIVYGAGCYKLRDKSFLDFECDLEKIRRKYFNEEIVYITIEEKTTLLFIDYIKKNSDKNFKYLLPDLRDFLIARDKKALSIFCKEQRFPTPRSFSRSEAKENKKFIQLLCKPSIGSGAKNFVFINKEDEIRKLDLLNENDYIIQEMLPNGKDVIGAFFLFFNGEPVSYYCHKRIRTFPISGGVTVYSSIEQNNEIIETGINLLKKLQWSGFAMVEFLWDPREKCYKIIEINPRLWGSVLLSEYSGANFIINYVNKCLNKPLIERPLNQSARIRWLIFDFINLLKAKGKIRGFWKLDRKNTCYINCTYSNWWSIFWFHLYFYFNITNLIKFIEKWKK